MRARIVSGDLSLSVPREGLWIGRSPDCDLVVDDSRVSQVHAMLAWRGDRLLLIPLGRNPTRVRGEVVERSTPLADRDAIAIADATWTVSLTGEQTGEAWVAVLPSGQRVGLGRRAVTLGDGADDDVRVVGWPPGALRVHRPGSGALIVEAGVELTHDADALEPGGFTSLSSGATLRIGAVQLVLLALASERGTRTVLTLDAALPTAATFRFTPTGGVLTLTFVGGDPVEVDLPELRARLFAVLLGASGDEVEDEDVIRSVWPGSKDRDRLDLNQLVTRARRDLLAAGVDPTPLLVRPRRGGATRFRMAAGASISVT